MSKKHQIIVFLISFLLMGAYSIWAGFLNSDKTEKIPKENVIYLQQKSMLEGLCEPSSTEGVDRWLLQQSWFHDSSFQEIAGAFGDVAFTLYIQGSNSEEKVEGVYCIEGDTLKVQFYETRRKLQCFDLNSNGLSMQYEGRLKPKEKESIRIVSLDKKQMVLYFESQNREQRLYRKN